MKSLSQIYANWKLSRLNRDEMQQEVIDELPIIKRWNSFNPSDPNMQNDLQMDYLQTQAVWNTAKELNLKPYEVMNALAFRQQKIEPADFDYTGDMEVNPTTAKYIYYAKLSTFGWWVTKGFAPPRLWFWICLRDFSAFCMRHLEKRMKQL